MLHSAHSCDGRNSLKLCYPNSAKHLGVLTAHETEEKKCVRECVCRATKSTLGVFPNHFLPFFLLLLIN